MKIHNINKKDLLVIEEIEYSEIELILVPIDEIMDEETTLIISVGDEDHPVDQNKINRVTADITLLIASSPQMVFSNKIVVTIPDNIPIRYADAEKYDSYDTDWDEFKQLLTDHPTIVDTHWFFININYNTSTSQINKVQQELKKIAPDLKGLILKDKIEVYYEC